MKRKLLTRNTINLELRKRTGESLACVQRVPLRKRNADGRTCGGQERLKRSSLYYRRTMNMSWVDRTSNEGFSEDQSESVHVKTYVKKKISWIWHVLERHENPLTLYWKVMQRDKTLSDWTILCGGIELRDYIRSRRDYPKIMTNGEPTLVVTTLEEDYTCKKAKVLIELLS